MSAILCFVKTATFLSVLLRIFSGAETINSTPSKLVTTLKGTLTPVTTPANPPANPQIFSSNANTDFQTPYTTQSSVSASTTEPYMSTVTAAETTATTTTKHQPQPSAHRIPSRLEEKLESLSCDIPSLPTESRLWRGNETHELMLPITVSKPNQDYLYLFMAAGVNTIRWKPESDVAQLGQKSVKVPH